MPTLLIDVTRLLGRLLKGRLPTGVDRVGVEYLRRYKTRCLAVVRIGPYFCVLSPVFSNALIDELIGSPKTNRTALLWVLIKNFWHFRMPMAGEYLVNTGHSGLEQQEYPQWIFSAGLKPIYFIHDLIPISHPQYSRAGEANKHRVRIHNALLSAAGIITNSTDTLHKLEEHSATIGLPMPPTTVALLASAPLVAAALERPIQNPYFVILGTIEGRKNHLTLLMVWKKLLRILGNDCPTLIIIGQRGWQCDDVLYSLDHDAELGEKVIEISRCNDVQLVTYLKHSQALLFPSLIEGFGMPLVEALGLGVPVIASNLKVFSEITGNIPEYLEPEDTDCWLEMVLSYLDNDSVVRRSQLQRMIDFNPPTWTQHFIIVDTFLRRLS